MFKPAMILLAFILFTPAETVDAAPSLIWSRTFNGNANQDDRVGRVTVDPFGNVIAGGQSDTGIEFDWMLRKYDNNGNFLCSAVFGAASSIDEIYDVAADSSGNIIAGGAQYLSSEHYNFRVHKYTPAGILSWSRTYNSGGFNDDKILGVAVDPSDNIIVAGYENRSDLGQSENIRIVKYNAAGTSLWMTSYTSPGNNTDVGMDVATDQSGNIFVGGLVTQSAQRDALLLKYDPTGALVWSRTYNRAGADDAYSGITTDSAGNVYASGEASLDWMLVKYDSAGTEQWRDLYNSPGNDQEIAMAVATDPAGDPVAVGFENRPDKGEDWNYLIRKYTAAGALSWSLTYNSPGNSQDYARGAAFDSSGNLFVGGIVNRPDISQMQNWLIWKLGQTPNVNITTVKEQMAANPGVGESIAYRVIVTNTGEATITDLTVVDTVSSTITNVTFDQPTGWTAPTVTQTTNGTRYVWSRLACTMAPGIAYTFTITGAIGLVCGVTPLSNTAYAIAAAASGSANMLSNMAGTIIQPPVTSILVMKSQTPVSPGIGGPVTYQVVVTNTGSATITTLTVTDTVSPIITGMTTDRPAGWAAPTVTQSANGTQYAWSRIGFTMNPGETYTFTISGLVGTVCAQTSVSNTAWVVATTACTTVRTYSNRTDFLLTAPTLTYTVAKEQEPAAPQVGEAVTYRVIVTNTGGVTIESMTVVDTVSPIFVGQSSIEPSEFGPPTVVSAVGTGTRYVWSATGLNLFPGTSYTFTIAGTMGLVCSPVTVANTAYVMTSTACTNAGMFSNAVGHIIQSPVTGISAMKSQTPAFPGIGGPVTYQVVVTNTGSATITTLTVTDTISPVITGVTTDRPAGWAAPVVTQAATGTQFAWSRAGLMMNPGETYTFTISGLVGTVCAQTSVSNTAWVVATTACTTVRTYSNRTDFLLAAQALAYTATKEQEPAAPLAGEAVTYRVIVTNTGGMTIESMTVIDTVSPVITGSASQQPAPMGAPTVTNVAGAGTRYVWSAAGLPFFPGTTYTFTITGLAGIVSTSTPISNTALVIAGNTCTSANAISNATGFTLDPPLVLGVGAVKILTPPSPTTGAVVTYRIVAVNTGTRTITALLVTDTVSAPVSVNATSQPLGWTAPVATSTTLGTLYVWSSGGLTLPPGGTCTFTITGVVGEVYAVTPVINKALVTATGGSTTLSTGSNSTSFTASPIPPTLLARQSISTTSPVSGGSVTYLVTVENTGTKPITNLTIIDTLSPIITNVRTTSPGGFGPPTVASIIGTGTRYVWSATGINFLPGQSLTITITGTVGTVPAAATVGNHAGAGTDYPGGKIWSSTPPVSFNLAPTEPELGIGQVRVIGGIRGYLNPKQGEQATILLRTSGAGEIAISIYNLKGDMVRTIRDVATDGNHVIVLHWNATDDTGSQVPPGVYPVLIKGPGIRHKDTLAVLR